MNKQLHKIFDDKEVITIFKKYITGELDQRQAQALLKIGRSRFFDLLKKYQEDPSSFTIEYQRKRATRAISERANKRIIEALEQEKKLIEDHTNPIRNYNYSFIRETLERKNGIQVSLGSIINRAKKMNFIRNRKSEKDMIEK